MKLRLLDNLIKVLNCFQLPYDDWEHARIRLMRKYLREIDDVDQESTISIHEQEYVNEET